MFGNNRDSDPPDRLITRILEFAIGIAVSGYLIKLGIDYFLSVWPVLAIITAVIGGIIIGWRIYKHWRDNQWR